MAMLNNQRVYPPVSSTMASIEHPPFSEWDFPSHVLPEKIIEHLFWVHLAKGETRFFWSNVFSHGGKNHGGKWDLIKNDEEMTSNTLKDHVQTFVKNKTNLV